MARNKQSYGSSNVLVRVYEKNLLSNDYFERLLSADNEDEMLQILEETNYRHYMTIDNRDNISNVAMQALKAAYKKIFDISPDQKLSEYLSLRYTYHNIKLNMKENITGDDLSHLYIPITLFNQSAIDYAITSGESRRLPEEYVKSINEAREEYEEFRNLYSVDIIMDRRYLTHLRILAEEIGDPGLINFTEKFIDYRNLVTLVRGMKQNRTRNFFNSVLSSSGSIPKSDIIELAHNDLSDVIEYYERTHLDKVIDRVSDHQQNEIDGMKLEAILDDEIMRMMQESKRTASGPLPITAFIHAKEIEVKNLRIIRTAKSVNLANDEIRERMRLNYVT
jgi:V/A-type H+-transporting ATPase subunit C